MIIYFLVFVIALIYYYVAGEKYSSSARWFVLFMLGLAVFVGLGDMIGGYDRYIYGDMFDTIADETRSKRNYANIYYLINGKEYGYFLWEIFVSLFTANRYIYIFVTTICVYLLYIRAFRMYIEDYPLATILFLGLFYYFTMTYLRQVIAVGIAWQAIKYVWTRNPICFFGLVFIASTFHNSAWVFLPLYFVPIKKFSKKTILVALGMALLVGLTSIPEYLLSNTGDALQMGTRTQAYVMDEMGGFRKEYFLEVVFFIAIFYMNYPLISKDKKSLVMFNMSLVFCAILLIFIRFGQGGRFGWYYMFGLIYTLSYLCNHRDAFKWMKPCTLVLSLVLFVRVTFAWAILLYPYKTFLTNGYPSSMHIYEQYEYDAFYTENKLYRPVIDIVF